MVQRVYIVRHGETDYNVEHRWQGSIDAPLNALGLEQAQKLAAYLKEHAIDAIVSSDLRRAYDTALAVAKLKNLEVMTDIRLREMSLGVFEGMTRAELDVQYPQEVLDWYASDAFAPENGESRLEVQARMLESWDELSTRTEENILILSHGGAIRLLLQKLIPKQMEGVRFGNTAISILEKRGDGWHGALVSQAPHLK